MMIIAVLLCILICHRIKTLTGIVSEYGSIYYNLQTSAVNAALIKINKRYQWLSVLNQEYIIINPLLIIRITMMVVVAMAITS